MIKANELRIGNLIFYLDELYMVDGLKYEDLNPDKYRVEFKTIDGKLRNAKILSWIKPVPLTPEIMGMAGFEDVGNYMTYELGEVIFHFDKRSEMLGLYTNDEGIADGLICTKEYVHQLQNLYFDLTGEELKLDIKSN